MLAKKVIVLSGVHLETSLGTRSFELGRTCACPYSNRTALPSVVHANPDIAGPAALPAVWQLHPVPVHVWILTNILNFVLKQEGVKNQLSRRECKEQILLCFDFWYEK